MNVLWAVVKHEIQKILKDPKTLLSILVVPLLSSLLLTFMGNINQEEGSDYTIYIIGKEETGIQSLELDNATIVMKSWVGTPEELFNSEAFAKRDICIDLLQCKVYFNRYNSRASYLKNLAMTLIGNEYKDIFWESVNLDRYQIEYVNFAQNMDINVRMMAIFLPYMLILLLFTNVTNYTSDSIAGEKERGVFEKTLLAPVNSGKVIMGKTIAGIIVGVVSTSVYMLMVWASSLLAENGGVFGGASIPAGEMLLIILYALLITYLFATILVLCSLFAKTSKEARSYALPVMGITLGMAIFSMLRSGSSDLKMYLLPVYNVCIILQDILMEKATLTNMLAVVGSLLVCSVLVFAVSNRVYRSERIRC